MDSADVKIVGAIPTTGFNTIADDCFFSIQCTYEENLQQVYEGTKWWQNDKEDPLFFTTSKAISPDDFLNNRDDGVSSLFSDMIND